MEDRYRRYIEAFYDDLADVNGDLFAFSLIGFVKAWAGEEVEMMQYSPQDRLKVISMAIAAYENKRAAESVKSSI